MQTLKDLWAKIDKRWLVWLLACLLSFLAGRWGIDVPVPPPPTEPAHERIENGNLVGAADFVGAQGWVDDPDQVALVAAGLPQPVFADTPAGRSDDPLPSHVYLWDAYKRISGGKLPPTKNQGGVGSCVSFGTNTAIDRTMAVQIAIDGRAEKLKPICEEATYGGSRVEVGGGRIRGDGSVGAWAAKFVRDWGILPRERDVGGYDLTEYSESRCREWGRRGVPDNLEPIAREHPVKAITLVKSWDEAKRALAQGYGIAICSNQGFSMRRDANGVCAPRGSWAHCMGLDGYHIEGGREYGHIENSWGPNAHTGPVGWGSPGPGGFWADSRTIDRMLRQGDSWAFSNVQGFPARRIDWFVMRDAVRTRQFADVRRDLFPLLTLAP